MYCYKLSPILNSSKLLQVYNASEKYSGRLG